MGVTPWRFKSSPRHQPNHFEIGFACNPPGTPLATQLATLCACKLSKCSTRTRKSIRPGASSNVCFNRRLASSQNIGFCPLSTANACSSSLFTAVCTGVVNAPSTRSINSLSGKLSDWSESRTVMSALLRWPCGVATIPSVETEPLLDACWFNRD